MDPVLALKAIIMGIVEGLTEFLPISFTGRLILAGSLLDFTVLSGLFSEPRAQNFALSAVVVFLTATLLGWLFAKAFKEKLFAPVPAAVAFIVGGFINIPVERRNRNSVLAERIQTIDDMRLLDTFRVGCAQALTLIPSISRSGASIISGMFLGRLRKAATKFLFFLAITTLMGATFHSVFKDRALLSVADISLFGLGGLSAFISAFLCMRWLLRYISTHDFTFFAYYRIVFGLFILLSAHYGWVVWAD